MPEKDLYEPVRNYLELRFRDRLQPLYGELRPISAITATTGGSGTGKWSKPDLCLLALWRHKYSPSWQLDLHGFEVKPDGRCTAEFVHEALNHTSHVHRNGLRVELDVRLAALAFAALAAARRRQRRQGGHR